MSDSTKNITKTKYLGMKYHSNPIAKLYKLTICSVSKCRQVNPNCSAKITQMLTKTRWTLAKVLMRKLKTNKTLVIVNNGERNKLHILM